MLYTSLKKKTQHSKSTQRTETLSYAGQLYKSSNNFPTSVLIILPTPAFILNGEGEECVFEYRQVGRATSFSNVTILRGKRNNKRERKQDLTS